MSYQSLTFIMFTAVVLVLYYTVGKKQQLWVLALANVTFYALAGVKYLPFIFATTLTTYMVGRKIGSIYQKADTQLGNCETSEEKKQVRNTAKKQAKRFLLLALGVVIALLAVCKYTRFAVINLNHLLSFFKLSEISLFNMVLPLGISFYTFMAISYVLDIYWKRYQAEKNFLIYAVFLSYFPHVVQGPIDRFNEFKEQVKDGIPFRYQNLTYGAQLVLWGFFKKLVIADRIGLFVGEVVDHFEKYDGILITAAIVAYSVQIYADFSGCIDIVSGVSEMFGIQLRKNFKRPYFSRTMGEFWRRWHISLQEWFKDYVYYPVTTSAFIKKTKKQLKAKNKKKAEELFTSCFPVLVVWLITGIWHGASWKFVAWGLFHACLLIGSQVFDPFFKKLTKWARVDTENFGWHCIQMARTFFLCCVGRIFFRADRLRNALTLIDKMVFDSHFGAFYRYEPAAFGLAESDVPVMIVSVLVLLVVDILQEKMPLRETLSKQNLVFRWLIIFAGLFAVILFGIYGPGYDASSFIYEQF